VLAFGRRLAPMAVKEPLAPGAVPRMATSAILSRLGRNHHALLKRIGWVDHLACQLVAATVLRLG